MNALINIIPILFILFIVFGRKDIKVFLLSIGIILIPFRTTFDILTIGQHIGWTNGIVITISDVSFILLFLYLIINNKNMNKVSYNILIPTVFFIAACALSLINSTWFKPTMYQVIMISQIFFLYYFVLTNCIETEKVFNYVVFFLTISLLFQGTLAILQFTSGHTFDYFSTGKGISTFKTHVGDSGIIRTFGTVGKPNGFAAYLVPLIILNITLLLGTKQLKKFRFTATVVGILALLFSFSRGGWISLIVSFLFLFLFLLKKKVVKQKTAISIFIIAGLIIVSCLPKITERITGDDKNAAGSRIPLMKLAFNMIKEHPIIGVGTNTFRHVVHSYAYTPDLQDIYLHSVHNQYLLVLAESGLIGIVTFLWVMKNFVLESVCKLKQKENRSTYFVGLGIRFGFVAVLIHMLVDMYCGYMMLANLFVLSSILTARKNLLYAKNSQAKLRRTYGLKRI